MSFDFDIDAEEDWFFNTDPICDFPNSSFASKKV